MCGGGLHLLIIWLLCSGGNLFILIAPHIGISNSMQLGKYSRKGQERDGAACGAAVGALCHCQAHEIPPDAEFLGSHPADYQMQFLISEIAKRQECINCLATENEKQAELTRQVYDIAIVSVCVWVCLGVCECV